MPYVSKARDWEAIGRDWANPHLTLGEIATRHDMTTSTLRKHARRLEAEGVWQPRPRMRPGARTAAEKAAAEQALKAPPETAPEQVYEPQFNDAGRELPPKGLKGSRRRKEITAYTRRVGDRICDLVAQGWSLEDVCRLPDTPAYRRVVKWLRSPEHRDFHKAYWEAREAALHLEMDDFNRQVGDLVTDTADPKKKVSTQQVQALRERRQHLEFKLTNLLSQVFRATGRNIGRNAGEGETKKALGGLAAAARRGTKELEDMGVIDMESRRPNLRLIQGEGASRKPKKSA